MQAVAAEFPGCAEKFSCFQERRVAIRTARCERAKAGAFAYACSQNTSG